VTAADGPSSKTPAPTRKKKLPVPKAAGWSRAEIKSWAEQHGIKK